MRRGILKFGSQIGLLLLCASAQASGALFGNDDVLDVELRGPLKATLRDNDKREERRFVLVHDGREIGVDVRMRGKSRATACYFPPLRMDFSGSETQGTPFDGQGAIKLVTHCKSGKAFDQNVVEEYLTYRLFQLVSETAYRVRLLRVVYVDTDRPKREPLSRYAFALEPVRALANRTGGQIVKTEYVSTAHLDKDQTALLFVFQFLVGNTDWSLVTATGEKHCCHNVSLIEIDGLHVPVPYDFDQAGVVNAAYARPHPGLGLRTVRTRRYRGNCVTGLDLEPAVRRVAALEPEILALIGSLPDATDDRTRGRIEYLEEFFDEARDPAELAAVLEQHCVD